MNPPTRAVFTKTEAEAYIVAAKRNTQWYVPYHIYKYVGKSLWLVKCGMTCPTNYVYVDSVDMLQYNSGM